MSGYRKHRLRLERLEDRLAPATQAIFNDGVLTVIGDHRNNQILVAADEAGNLVVTDAGQQVRIRELRGQATRDQLVHLHVDGGRGNDVLLTDASLNTVVDGSLAFSPTATLLGGLGNDTITVGHGGIVGGLAGVDLSTGEVIGQVVGNAFMDGGPGNDVLTSGFGNDIMLGGSGNDAYIWPPGTLTDVWHGGTGFDTVTIIGNDSFAGAPAGDAFQLTANGSRVLFQRTNLVRFKVDIGTTESIVLRPGAGDDVVTIGDLTGVASLRRVAVEGNLGNDRIDGSAQANRFIGLDLDGGDGDDVLKGGAGRDRLLGGEGNDDLDGGAELDLLFGGNGDDRLDGGNDNAGDIVLGGSGADTFVRRRRDVFLDFQEAEGDQFELV